MSLIHYSRNSRYQGHLGGVEKFAWYLNRCLGAAVYAPPIDRPKLFQRLGRNLHKGGKLAGNIVVVDGGYLGSLSAEASEYAVVSMMHGTWAWRYHAMEGLPYPQLRHRPEVKKQAAAWSNPRLPVVACADHVAEELTEFMGIQRPVTVLRHGVDTEIFHPPERRSPRGKKPLIIHAASDRVKRKELLPKLEELLPEFEFQFLGIKSGRLIDEANRWRQGDLFLHLAAKEGNSYAILEAMATNLPTVVTKVGIFASNDAGCCSFARTVSPSLPVENLAAVAEAVRETWENRQSYHPRQWIMENATMEKFATDWHNYLNKLAAERGLSEYDSNYK